MWGGGGSIDNCEVLLQRGGPCVVNQQCLGEKGLRRERERGERGREREREREEGGGRER